MPGAHHQVVRRLALDDQAALGEIGLVELLVARVVHDEAEQLAVGGALADMEREAVLGAGERAGLDDLRQDVGAHLHDVLPQELEAPGHAEVIDEGDAERDELSGGEVGRCRLEAGQKL